MVVILAIKEKLPLLIPCREDLNLFMTRIFAMFYGQWTLNSYLKCINAVMSAGDNERSFRYSSQMFAVLGFQTLMNII